MTLQESLIKSINSNFAASMKTKAGKEQLVEQCAKCVATLLTSLSSQQVSLEELRRQRDTRASEYQSLVRVVAARSHLCLPPPFPRLVVRGLRATVC